MRKLLIRQRAPDTLFLLAIDGRCAAGKSTLAAALAGETGAQLVHADSFFLRPSQRTAQRLDEPGGNLDRERLLEEVLLPLREGRDAVYSPYDCHKGGFGERRTVSAHGLIIIEGSYSCHPALWEHYDAHVFLDIDPESRRARIEKRNPDPQRFFTRWIPLEERYFEYFAIKEKCELVLNYT